MQNFPNFYEDLAAPMTAAPGVEGARGASLRRCLGSSSLTSSDLRLFYEVMLQN